MRRFHGSRGLSRPSQPKPETGESCSSSNAAKESSFVQRKKAMAPEISNGLVCDLLSALFSAQRHSHTQRTVLYMYTHRYTCTAPLNVTALRVAYMYSKRVHPGSFPDRQRHGQRSIHDWPAQIQNSKHPRGRGRSGREPVSARRHAARTSVNRLLTFVGWSLCGA